MTKKPTGLAAAVSKKASVVVPEPQPAADGKTRTLTLRLPRLSTSSYARCPSRRGDRSTRC